MKHKEIYKDINIKNYSVDSNEEYLVPLVKIEGDRINWIDEMSDVCLWALFGVKDDTEVEMKCLQVGASIEGRKEINEDIIKMFKGEYSQEKIPRKPQEIKWVNTQFYLEAYCIPKKDGVDKTMYQYRKIKEDFSKLIFYKIDIDKYLNVDDSAILNFYVREIYNLSKSYYAESKFAFDTQSLYWNAYRSGVGMDTLKHMIEIN